MVPLVGSVKSIGWDYPANVVSHKKGLFVVDFLGMHLILLFKQWATLACVVGSVFDLQ